MNPSTDSSTQHHSTAIAHRPGDLARLTQTVSAQVEPFTALVAAAWAMSASVGAELLYTKSPRLDTFVREEAVWIPFLSYDQFSDGPGAWMPYAERGERYAQWVLGFRAAVKQLTETHGITVIPIDAQAVRWKHSDDPAKLLRRVQNAPHLITVSESEEGTERLQPSALTVTYYGEAGADLCAMAVAHNSKQRVFQRSYFPVTPKGARVMAELLAGLPAQLGLAGMRTARLMLPETCACCGHLRGQMLDPEPPAPRALSRLAPGALATLPARTAPSRPAAGPSRNAAGPSRNAPCPCGSGKKYKRCCGR